MELRASSKCSAVANACLVAGQYSAVKITHVVDEAATEVVLSGTADGEVKGNEAVLRCVGEDKGVHVVKVLAAFAVAASSKEGEGQRKVPQITSSFATPLGVYTINTLTSTRVLLYHATYQADQVQQYYTRTESS